MPYVYPNLPKTEQASPAEEDTPPSSSSSFAEPFSPEEGDSSFIELGWEEQQGQWATESAKQDNMFFSGKLVSEDEALAKLITDVKTTTMTTITEFDDEDEEFCMSGALDKFDMRCILGESCKVDLALILAEQVLQCQETQKGNISKGNGKEPTMGTGVLSSPSRIENSGNVKESPVRAKEARSPFDKENAQQTSKGIEMRMIGESDDSDDYDEDSDGDFDQFEPGARYGQATGRGWL